MDSKPGFCLYCGAEMKHLRGGNGNRKYCNFQHYRLHYSESHPIGIAAGPRIERGKKNHLAIKLLWGSSGRGVGEIGLGLRAWAKEFEQAACEVLLPKIGFSELENLSNMSNQFFIDIVGTDPIRQRALIDVTTKTGGGGGGSLKVRMARILRMPFYFIHVAPDRSGNFCLNIIPEGESTSKIPARYFNCLFAIRNHVEFGVTDPYYKNVNRSFARKAFSRMLVAFLDGNWMTCFDHDFREWMQRYRTGVTKQFPDIGRIWDSLKTRSKNDDNGNAA